MIYSYGCSHIGPYHVKNNIVCQDSHFIQEVKLEAEGETICCVVAAVADGLGSAAYSDVGSSIAAKVSVQHCAHALETRKDELLGKNGLSILKEAFTLAKEEVEKRAKLDGNPAKEYDTTLDLVIFGEGHVLYGHAGDSGIIIYTQNGEYKPLTQQVQDDMGRVFPLCFDDSWCFGIAKETIASVLLCTDGMWDMFFPTLLRNEKNPLYVAQAAFFMDPVDLGYYTATPSEVADFMSKYVDNIKEEKVNDDKTVVYLYDDSIPITKQPEEYYAMPDFVKLQKEQQARFLYEAYPHLYNKDGTKKDASKDTKTTTASGTETTSKTVSSSEKKDSPQDTTAQSITPKPSLEGSSVAPNYVKKDPPKTTMETRRKTSKVSSGNADDLTDASKDIAKKIALLEDVLDSVAESVENSLVNVKQFLERKNDNDDNSGK